MKISDSRHPFGIRGTAAAAVVLGALALAGCGSSTSKGTATPSVSSSLSASASASASMSGGDGSGGGSKSASASSSNASSPAAPSSSDKPATSTAPSTGAGRPADCTADKVKLTAAAVREPINHVLITATNTSQSRCRLIAYPAVKYDPDQQSAVPAAEATKPKQDVVLAPGASAYAGLMTSSADGSGKNGKDRPTIVLQLAGGNGGEPGAPVTVAMPKGAQYVDDSAQISYWVTDQQTALN